MDGTTIETVVCSLGAFARFLIFYPLNKRLFKHYINYDIVECKKRNKTYNWIVGSLGVVALLFMIRLIVWIGGN